MRFVRAVVLVIDVLLPSYLHEYQALGTAGGIYHFRDEILRGHTKQFFVMHIDIACSFPLNEMVAAHRGHRSICTMLGTKVSESYLSERGDMMYLIVKYY